MQGALAALAALVTVAWAGRNVSVHILPTHSFIHAEYVSGEEWPQPDETEFPLFKQATGLQFTLHAGDQLYFPIDWWHWVFSDGSPTIALTIWTLNPHREFDRPTVIRGGAKSWPAYSKWSLEYFAQLRDKDMEASLKGCKSGSNFYPEDAIEGHVSTVDSLNEFVHVVDELQSNRSDLICFSATRLSKESLLLADIELPAGISPTDQGILNNQLWISHGQVQSGLHYDQWYNTITVLKGTKRFILFPPTQTEYLYPVFKCSGCDKFQRRQRLQEFLESPRRRTREEL